MVVVGAIASTPSVIFVGVFVGFFVAVATFCLYVAIATFHIYVAIATSHIHGRSCGTALGRGHEVRTAGEAPTA